MYANAGYLTNEDIDIVDIESPLLVSSCGTYRLLHKKSFSTSRPSGRKDYQLLYVASGKAYFYFDREYSILSIAHQTYSAPPTSFAAGTTSYTFCAPAGSFVIYTPDQMQLYEYFLEDHPEVHWVHFTGWEVNSLLEDIGLQENVGICLEASNDYRALFQLMIRELQLKRPCCQELLVLYLRQLFCLIRRGKLEYTPNTPRPSKEIEEAIHYFNEYYTQNICIEDYATAHHISISWFIRSFKQYTGITPRQYLTALRLNKAKSLLQINNDSIQEIANVVGYDDPLYFSRIFKKYTGHAPSWYRHPN